MRGSTTAVFTSLALGVLAVEGGALAQDRVRVGLGYDVARAEADCPDEASFRNLVAARLGYDPFADGADDRVDVEIVAGGRQLRGRAAVLRGGQKATGGREIVGLPRECEALAAALATTVAIALDPVHALGAARPVPAVPSPDPTTPPPIPLTAPPNPSPPRAVEYAPAPAHLTSADRVRLFGSASGVASIATAPSVTLGGEVGVGLSVRAFSLEMMGRVETTPGAARVSSGDRLEVTILSATILPCANLGGFRACAFGRFGALQGYAPDVTTPTLQTSAFASLGARTGYTLDLTRIFGVRGEIEAGFPLVRTSLAINQAPIWTAPPVVGAFSLGAVVCFL
jgi:hypothetical protein